jgi:uncharacterized Zn-finger protein
MANKDQEIDTEHTDQLTCPYCGRVDRDGHEYFQHSECQEVQCGHCEREFDAVQHVSVTYSAKKKGA